MYKLVNLLKLKRFTYYKLVSDKIIFKRISI